MNHYPESVTNLIECLSKLPGIGKKTAERLSLHILKAPREESEQLSAGIMEAKNTVRLCKRCFSLSDHEMCSICSNTSRTPFVICVVENPADMIAIEKSGSFRGLYHILGGSLSPMDGIGPDDIRIRELTLRIKKEKIKEIILATGTNVEGETTASYISEILRSKNVTVTRIASGIPIGGDLKYVDQVTLKRAMEGRHDI